MICALKSVGTFDDVHGFENLQSLRVRTMSFPIFNILSTTFCLIIVWVRKRYRKPVTTGNTVILDCEEANAERVFQVVLI